MPFTSRGWPLPNRDQRQRYHNDKAQLAKPKQQWFAAAFHRGKLADDRPWDAAARLAEAQAWQKAGQTKRAAFAAGQAQLLMKNHWLGVLELQALEK